MRDCQKNFDKKEQTWRYQPPKLQTILQSDSNQNIMVLTKNGPTDLWNRRESPEINTCTCDQLIHYKHEKNVQWRREQSLQRMMLRKLDSYM